MSTASLFEAKTHLSALIARVERTRVPVVITRHGKPVAKLVPCDAVEGDVEERLEPFRALAREAGTRFDWSEVNEPLGPEVWGEVAGDAQVRGNLP